MHFGNLRQRRTRGVPHNGFSVIFDENHTGQDFDSDGNAEVVFITDTGGGNHCCWDYNVIFLSPKPHRLFDAPFGARFEKDKLGTVLLDSLGRSAGP